MGCCNSHIKKTILIIGDYYSMALSTKYLTNENIIIANNNSTRVIEEIETHPEANRNKNITILPLNLKSNKSIFNFLNIIRKYQIDIIINTPSYKGEYTLTEDRIESHMHENNLSIFLINLFLLEKLNPDARIITLIQNNYKSNNLTVESIKELGKTIHFDTIIGIDDHPYFGNSMQGLIFISKYLEGLADKNNFYAMFVEKLSVGCEEVLTACIYDNIESLNHWKDKHVINYPNVNEEIMREFINYCWLNINVLINKDESIISNILKYRYAKVSHVL